MPQVLTPISIESAGGWTDEVGSTANLHLKIDESSPDDGDYIQSGINPLNDAIRIKLSSGSDPNVSSGYSVSYRLDNEGSGATSVSVVLYEGTTSRAVWSHELAPDSFQTFTQTLTSSQANAIVDHTNLYLEIIAQNTIQVQSWDYLTTFDYIHNENWVPERFIDHISVIDGKLWPSYGEYDQLGGARPLLSADPDTGVVTDEYGSNLTTDHLTSYQTSNGNVFVTYTDPSVGTWPGYAKRISGTWSTGGNDVVVAHVFDFIEWGGAYYMCGASGVGGEGATIWKSTNSGASWTKDYTSGTDYRFYNFYDYGDRLYVQVANTANQTVENGRYTTGSGWILDAGAPEIPIAYPGFSAIKHDVTPWRTHLYSVRRQKGIGTIGSSGIPSVGSGMDRHPLDRSASNTEPFSGSLIRSIVVDEDNDVLYLLTSTTFFKMYRETFRTSVLTRDFMPFSPMAVTIHDGHLFVADTGGRIWKSNPNPMSPMPTLIETFGTLMSQRGFTIQDTDIQISFGNPPTVRSITKTGGAWGNPRIVYNTPFTRSNSLYMEFLVPHLVNANASWYIGFASTATPTSYDTASAAFGKVTGSLARANPTVGSVSLYNAGGTETYSGREYRVAVRNQGAVFYMRGVGLATPYDDSGPNRARWLPVGMEHLNTTASLYATVSVNGSVAGAFTMGYMHVYESGTNVGTVEDTFTRADSTTTLGSPEIGENAWSAVSGTWGISSNQAYSTTTGSTALAVIDAEESDGIVTANVSGISGTVAAGVVFRSDGTDQNYWRAYYDGTNFKVDKIVGGSVTNVHSAADAGTSGIVQVTLYDDHISVHKGAGANTVASIAITDAALQNNTRHGLYTNQAAANARFDNFYMFGPVD